MSKTEAPDDVWLGEPHLYPITAKSQWLPIDSNPKDGDPFIGLSEGGRFFECRYDGTYNDGEPAWVDIWADDDVHLTHWLPRSALPFPRPPHRETSMGGEWHDIKDLPPFGQRPIWQFIRLEGTTYRRGVFWKRSICGTATINSSGPHGYRREDIARLCLDGDIEPGTERVTHWMPAIWPALPDSPQAQGDKT